MSKNFAITGVAGYIAPRHLQAIKDTGNNLIAAVDPHDSVGILDKYFPEVSFFTEYERFDRHLEMIRRRNASEHLHYLSICSPNFLHDAHIRTALRTGANAICEKPLVLNPWNLDALEELEKETGLKVYNILQLRVHPSLIQLKEKLSKSINEKKYKVDLTYITSRGIWYDYSWKGVIEKSGGIATNIGIHFFDLLIWLFGNVQENYVHLSEKRRVGGFLVLQNAEVRWFLSTAREDLPKSSIEKNQSTFRSITVNNSEIEFSDGFTELHTKVYREILDSKGFGIDDARPSIEIAYQIRNTKGNNYQGLIHPFVQDILMRSK
ncbi:MAG: Gfo/Idh/MocA family oxidoreductase [Ignavibacteriaceae bacterium]|nr:Gfo/Idh/MocA family oxidoreductase [Ignavibacteriaceae bacterium]